MNLFGWRKKCCVCREVFRQVSDCDAGEIGAFVTRLGASKYTCPFCDATFHGRCAGRISGSGPVALKCPHCGQESSGHELPFRVRSYDEAPNQPKDD